MEDGANVAVIALSNDFAILSLWRRPALTARAASSAGAVGCGGGGCGAALRRAAAGDAVSQ